MCFYCCWYYFSDTQIVSSSPCESLFRLTPKSFGHNPGSGLPCFIVQQNISWSSYIFPALDLESAILKRNPGSFKRDMVIRGHNLGTGGAHWFWFSHYFRPLLWTELENIFLDDLMMKAKKEEPLSSYCTFISIEANGIKTGRDRKKLLSTS